MKVCLVIVFNHKFEKNIELLKKYYGNKFSNIFFLVPFYSGNNKSIINVYESSYQFQGYFAQGFNRFYNEAYTHYIFVGDDLLLNPQINEENICELFGVDMGESYIHSLKKLSDMSEWRYERFKEIDKSFKTKGTNYFDEIPSLSEAKDKAKKLGFSEFRITHVKKYTNNGNIKSKAKAILSNWFVEMDIEYPVLCGYSDLIIIPKKSIREFCRISGVFAAMNLFVEASIPTTMMLTCEKIRTSTNVKLRAEQMWETTKYANIISKFENSCNYEMNLINNFFPSDYAYIHPVKLSKWD